MAKFNFMVKQNGEKKWRDISELEAADLLKIHFTTDEIKEKIREIKCGHNYSVRGVQIEAWPKVGEV